MATRTYENDAIRVHWRSELCVHVARCLRGLPSVFDLNSRPWIDVDGAGADEIAAACEACPSGALTFERLDDGPQEAFERPARAMPARNGPLVLRGDVRICDPDGNEVARETRVTLCRCGQSTNQPFCDNSHRAIGFRAGSQPFGAKADLADAADEPIQVIPKRDASLRLKGPVVIYDPRGNELGRGDDLYLCRCGQSAAKPLCDSSHEGAGFRTTDCWIDGDRDQADSPAEIEPNLNLLESEPGV